MKQVYLFRIEATPKRKISDQIDVGKSFPILIFVLDSSLESAESKIYLELPKNEWEKINIEEKGAFDSKTLDDAEKDVMAAYRRAVRDGVATLIFTA